jgi:GDP-4-dehydro-6-deoxy-D-mannose reductase
MVRAYWLAVVRGRPGEVYNVATGVGIRIRDLLDRLIALSGVAVRVEVDPARLRPSDVEILVGDSSRFRADTGWEPRIPFDQTLSDVLDFWRARLGRAGGAPGDRRAEGAPGGSRQPVAAAG